MVRLKKSKSSVDMRIIRIRNSKAPVRSEQFSIMRAMRFARNLFRQPVEAGAQHMAFNFAKEIFLPLAKKPFTLQKNSTLGVNRNFDLFSVSGGGDIHINNALRIGGTVFRTERAPTTEELFSNGPHLATNQFEIGDVTLDKETATGAEAAIRFKGGNSKLTLNAFYAKTETGNLPRIPPLSTLVGLEAESDRLKLRGEWEYVAEANDLAAFELPTDDYNLVNGFLTWKAPMGAQDVALRFSVLNIFDAEARQHSSFLKDLVPQPGRNFRFSITAKL